MVENAKKILLCLAICFHCSTSTLTGYNCSSTTILEYDVLINDLLPSCQTIRETDKYYVKIVELPEQNWIGYQCKITFAETLVDVNGFSKVVANGSQPITRDECLEAHKTKYVSLSGDKVFVNTNRTISHEVSVGDHYEFVPGIPRNKTRKYRYIKTYDVTLSESIGTADLRQNMIRFDKNVVCDFDSYACHEDQIGLMAWYPIETERYSLLYSGAINFAVVSESLIKGREFRYAVITSKAIQKVFLLLTYGELTINGHKGYRTELPNVYVVFSEYGNNPRGWEYDGRLKNVYSVPYYSKHVDIVDLGKRRCISENHVLYIRLKSLLTFSRVLFDQEGTMGIKINKRTGSFSIQKCEKNDVRVRQTEKCYQEIPVQVGQNSERFLNPMSRVLTEHGTPVSCDQNQYNTTTHLVWFEHPTEYVEPSSSTTGTTTKISTSTTESPSVRLEAPNVKQSSLKSVCPDWIKVFGLVSLCLWVFVVIARLFTLVVCCVPGNNERGGSGDSKVTTFVKALNPLRIRHCFRQKQQVVVSERKPEPTVSFVVKC